MQYNHLWAQDRVKSATKTFQILNEAYGDETRAYVFKWYKRFPERRVSVEVDELAGYPRSVIIGQKIGQIRDKSLFPPVLT
ncbi:UNVERIFIED_CONTAM: hypothetical protein NCL1_35321 [Trichonephila clavipes]